MTYAVTYEYLCRESDNHIQVIHIRDSSGYGLSHCEEALLCNAFSHWLSSGYSWTRQLSSWYIWTWSILMDTLVSQQRWKCHWDIQVMNCAPVRKQWRSIFRNKSYIAAKYVGVAKCINFMCIRRPSLHDSVFQCYMCRLIAILLIPTDAQDQLESESFSATIFLLKFRLDRHFVILSSQFRWNSLPFISYVTWQFCCRGMC